MIRKRAIGIGRRHLQKKFGGIRLDPGRIFMTSESSNTSSSHDGRRWRDSDDDLHDVEAKVRGREPDGRGALERTVRVPRRVPVARQERPPAVRLQLPDLPGYIASATFAYKFC